MMTSSSAPGPIRRLAALSLAGALYTYVLVVYGGIVRITGSGMGCGDDWPNCNDALVPAFDVTTFIEYSHRVLAAGLSLLTLWVLVEAIRVRRAHGPAGARLTGPAWAAATLIVAQVLLGAVTVKLELPAGVTTLHFLTAMVLLATFILLAARAGALPGPAAGPADAGFAGGAAALTFAVLAFGALTANVGLEGPFPPSGAARACQGFPLCNGELWPGGSGWVHIHWTHRVLAFSLVAVSGWGAWRARHAPDPVRKAARSTAGLVILQVAVAASLVLTGLPQLLQAAHLAVGALVWGAAVAWALLARRAERIPAPRREPVVA